jgi:hypothetical protein
MPVRKQVPQEPAYLLGDVSAPIARTKPIFGHRLVLDGRAWTVELHERWMRFDENLAAHPETALALLADLFCDAILPANPDFDRDRLLHTFPARIQRNVMDGFFNWLVGNQSVAIEDTANEPPALLDERRAMSG